MSSFRSAPRNVVTALAGALSLALTAGCLDGLITKPSLYGTVEVSAERRNGAAIGGTGLLLYTGPRPMSYGTTDSTGSHTFSSVPQGAYGVHAVPPAGYVRLEDLIGGPPSDFVQDLQVRGGETLRARFSFLKEGLGAIVAEVTEPDGTPVAEVPLILYSSSGSLRTATSDATGHFAFDGVPLGAYGVFARRSAVYADSAENALVSRDGIVIEEGSREPVRFVFAPCVGSLTGSVRDETGSPVPGSILTVYRYNGDVEEVQTGADGTHVFAKLKCDGYGVRVLPPIGWTAPAGRGTSFNDGLQVHRGSALVSLLTVQTCRWTLRVRVADDAGVVLGGVPIALYTTADVYRNVVTGSDGLVVMDQIPCDRGYGVRVTPPAGYTVVDARGSSFFDGMFFTSGSVVDRAFTLVRK